mgnify:CR=1 FL=1
MDIINGMTIGNMFNETVKKHANRNAVEYMSQYWSYKQVDEITDILAIQFLEKGIKKGTKAALWVYNRPNALFVLLALEKIGAIPVMLHTSWKAESVENYLRFIEVEYLFYDEGYLEQSFTDFVKHISTPALREKIYIGSNICLVEDKKNAFSQQEKDALCAAKEQVTSEDIDMILFTSGSMGTAKGVVTTHFSRVNNAFVQAAFLRATCDDIFGVVLPMFHCFSMSGNIMAALSCGACISFPESRRTKHVFRCIDFAKVTVLTAVPTFYSALISSEWRNAYDYSSLRTGAIGGAGYSPSFFLKVEKELGMKLISSLGLTEATAGVTASRYDEPSEKSAHHVGVFLPNIDGRILKRNSLQECRTGEVGEICVRGYNVMKEYYKLPEETEDVIDENGFLHTGDMGYVDEEGNVHITGRCKELIIRGGENIFPGEIENVISELEAVAVVKVLGVKDAHYGEELCACISCKEGKMLSEENVREQVGKHLAKYKVPRYVIFMDQIPFTGNGKIDVNKLKEIIREKGI